MVDFVSTPTAHTGSEISRLIGGSTSLFSAAISCGPLAAAAAELTRTNPNFHVALKATRASTLTCQPNATFSMIMGAPSTSLRYSDVRIVSTGSCLDMMYLACCSRPGCNYKYANLGEFTPEQLAAVLPKVKKGVRCYVVAAPT